MNLEEAKANIRKEVIYNGSEFKIIGVGVLVRIASKYGANVMLEPHHIKLKEQPMNYKIKVTPETSAEVQELFFELGFRWISGEKTIQHTAENYLFAGEKFVTYSDDSIWFNQNENKEITIQQLRDLVVLKRNDVGDATHDGENGNKWLVLGKGEKYDFYFWHKESSKWISNPLNTNNHPKMTAINNNKEPQMTWEDALRAVANGKEVDMKFNGQFEPLINLLESWLYGKEFRPKPQTIPIIGGNYTKEELLKIAGEME